jgi:hypothetical protein
VDVPLAAQRAVDDYRAAATTPRRLHLYDDGKGQGALGVNAQSIADGYRQRIEGTAVDLFEYNPGVGWRNTRSAAHAGTVSNTEVRCAAISLSSTPMSVNLVR